MALAGELIYCGLTSRQADFLGDTQANALIAAGANQATATAIAASTNSFGTVAAGADGGRLPAIAGTLHSAIMVRNDDAADTLSIYPATGESINALAANTAITIAAGAARIFKKITSTKWVST